MVTVAKKLYTVQEYFELEAKAAYKNEYINGEIIPMAGASTNHQRITKDTLIYLENVLAGSNCEAFITDMKVQLKEGADYSYPDVLVVCGELNYLPNRDDTITNPCLILEVLSKSTQSYDKSGKFERYKQLETVQEYLLVSQKRVEVSYLHKQADGTWQEAQYNDLNASIPLKSIKLNLPLAEIYRRVKFEK
jgi:Uma2 family endonuclease